MLVGLRDGEAKGATDGLSAGAGVTCATGPKGGGGSVGAFVLMLLGDAPGLEVGPSVDESAAGDCVGLSPVISVGLREGEATGGTDLASTGAEVSGPSCPNSSVGAFVSLLLGDAPGLEVGPSVDPPAGDCVGLLPAMSVGLRDGEATGGTDRASTGVEVSGPSCPNISVGALVSLLLGDAPGLEVGPPVDSPAGDCEGFSSVMPVGLRDGAERGGKDRLSMGADVSGESGKTVRRDG
jgi:hypothetical protein